MTRLKSLFSSYKPLALVLLMTISNFNDVQAKLKPALFVFGDSFYDAGNNNYISTPLVNVNIPPYGETFFNRPTGRASDGRLIPDFIAQYGKLPFPPPFLQPGLSTYEMGVNFASIGAGALIETFQGRVISLITQVEHYKKVVVKLRQNFGRRNSKAILSKAVYIFNIGGNDYFYPLTINPSVVLTPKYVCLVVGNITSAIKEIYKLGGRKFAINKVGPYNCSPFAKATTNSTCFQPSPLALLHNQQLTQALVSLVTLNTGVKYGLFDMYTNLEKRTIDPTNYGFKNSSTACCGSGPYRGIFSCGGQGNLTKYEVCPNPKEFVFWDSIHPTETTYKQLAKLIWAGSSSDICPYNVKTLFQL